MRNHLHPLMKQSTYCNDSKPLSGSTGWFSNLGMWYGSVIRFNRRLKPWAGAVEREAV